MIARLSPQDASFYAVESSNHPMHIGSLAILQNRDGALDYERLCRIVERRLPLVPRYRRKVRPVPLGLGRPVWVEDSEFDIAFHIRRSGLPAPGADVQLHDLVARLASRTLDRTRPLWEMHLIEGLADGRCALFTKSHAALVDGNEALEIGHVVLDADQTPREVAEDLWLPRGEPRNVVLMLDALGRLVSAPGEGVDLVRRSLGDVQAAIDTTTKALGRVASAVWSAARPAPDSPLNISISRNRRFAVADTALDDYRRIRRRAGGSVNEAILAVVAGALRGWLLSRNEPLTQSTTVRAVVPTSVYVDRPAGATYREAESASEVSSFLVDLPVGEPNPVIRLSHIAHAADANARQRRAVTARTLVRLSGFAPASMHASSIRSASTFGPHTFNLVITNAPGPQTPMYIGGARMLEMYPVSPLLRDQALSIGLTSYDGRVYYGFNADRDALADVDLVAALIYESLEELLDAV